MTADVNNFTFKKHRPNRKALPTFSVGDIQPAPGWVLLEEVRPEASSIIRVSIMPGTDEEKGERLSSETWRIIATGSDFIPNMSGPHKDLMPFTFVPGDEVIIAMAAAQSAHALPTAKDAPMRVLCQMPFVVGRVAKAADVEAIHSEN